LCEHPISIALLTCHLAKDGHALGPFHRLELHFDEGHGRRVGGCFDRCSAFRLVVHDESVSASILYPPRIGRTSRSAFTCSVERVSAAAESNKCQRTADDRHILHEVLELIQIAKLRVPDKS
jgi:hypothetical protein